MVFLTSQIHSYDILGARMLWKPKEARILKNFNVQNEECHNYGQIRQKFGQPNKFNFKIAQFVNIKM
jgi:hypothetical protein